MKKYTIHPIVMGTKVFDKSMMTYQYGQGEQYTIPIPSITAIWKIILTRLKKTARSKSSRETAKSWMVFVSNIRLFTQKAG